MFVPLFVVHLFSSAGLGGSKPLCLLPLGSVSLCQIVLKVVLCNTELKIAVAAVEKHSSVLHCPMPEYPMQCYASQSVQTHGLKEKFKRI